MKIKNLDILNRLELNHEHLISNSGKDIPLYAGEKGNLRSVVGWGKTRVEGNQLLVDYTITDQSLIDLLKHKPRVGISTFGYGNIIDGEVTEELIVEGVLLDPDAEIRDVEIEE